MDDTIEIDSDSESNEEEDDDSVYMPKLLKQEDVASSDGKSDDESVVDNPEEVSVEDVIKGYEYAPPFPPPSVGEVG